MLVGSRSLEVPMNHRFELLEYAGLDIKLSHQIGTHLTFHPVNPSKAIHTG